MPDQYEESDCGYESYNEDLERYRLDKTSSEAASRVFSSLAIDCPRLMAAVIVAPDPVLGGKQQRGFMRFRQTDYYGRTNFVGVMTDISAIKHHEPASDILEDEQFLVEREMMRGARS